MSFESIPDSDHSTFSQIRMPQDRLKDPSSTPSKSKEAGQTSSIAEVEIRTPETLMTSVSSEPGTADEESFQGANTIDTRKNADVAVDIYGSLQQRHHKCCTVL